jgi:hypothetical protein
LAKALDYSFVTKSMCWCLWLRFSLCPHLFSGLACWAVWQCMLPLFAYSLGGSWLRSFWVLCFLGLMGCLVQVGSPKVSSEGWVLSSHWSLLPTRQVVMEVCGFSLPDWPKWSYMFLFCQVAAESSTATTLAGQLFPQQGRVIQYCALPMVPREILRSATPQLWQFDCLHSVLGSSPQAFFLRLVQCSAPTLLRAVTYVHCPWHSVLLGGRWNVPMSCIGLFSQEGKWCVALTCWNCKFTPAGLGSRQVGSNE